MLCLKCFIFSFHDTFFLLNVSSGRHSRQDSSCSGDSGVYSAGGSSGLQQPNSAQSSTGIEASWRDPFDMDHVKMKDMAPGLKSQLLMADESIVDVCV